MNIKIVMDNIRHWPEFYYKKWWEPMYRKEVVENRILIRKKKGERGSMSERIHESILKCYIPYDRPDEETRYICIVRTESPVKIKED